MMHEIGNRPAGEIPQEHPLVQAAQLCLLAQEVQPILEIGSTDANVPLSLGYPAVCLGLTRGSNAHTSEEFILTAPLQKGINQVLCLIERIWINLPQMQAWQANRVKQA
jgi:acetylornithine deacetylase/succinyl-diaminopimelate desuccinylase-like protein